MALDDEELRSLLGEFGQLLVELDHCRSTRARQLRLYMSHLTARMGAVIEATADASPKNVPSIYKSCQLELDLSAPASFLQEVVIVRSAAYDLIAMDEENVS